MNLDTLKPEDFRRLYGEIPEAYSERVHRTLSRLPSQTQRAHRKAADRASACRPSSADLRHGLCRRALGTRRFL